MVTGRRFRLCAWRLTSRTFHEWHRILGTATRSRISNSLTAAPDSVAGARLVPAERRISGASNSSAGVDCRISSAQLGRHVEFITCTVGDTTQNKRLQVCGDLPAGVSRSIRLADLLGQSDDDAFRSADVAKPIRVLVLHHFAYQLGAVGEQARDDSVDVFDGEHDATDAQRVHRRVHGPKPDRVGGVELIELDATVAVRGPHQREGGANVLEPDQAVDRRSLDLRLAFELEAEFDEERLGRLEVVDNDENVVHPLNRHVLTLVCWGPSEGDRRIPSAHFGGQLEFITCTVGDTTKTSFEPAGRPSASSQPFVTSTSRRSSEVSSIFARYSELPRMARSLSGSAGRCRDSITTRVEASPSASSLILTTVSRANRGAGWPPSRSAS